MAQAQYTWEELKRPDRKKALGCIVMVGITAVMLIIFALNLFGVAEFMSDRSVSPGQIRLYGSIISGVLAAVSLWGWRSVLTKKPMRFIERYAKKTDDPGTALAQIRDTWENGLQIGRYRISEHYIIEIYNGISGKIVSLENMVWAFKSITKLNGVVKTNTSLHVQYPNGAGDFIQMSESTIDLILQHFMEHHRDIVVGNNQQVEKMYQKRDFAEMREYALQQRTGTAG